MKINCKIEYDSYTEHSRLIFISTMLFNTFYQEKRFLLTTFPLQSNIKHVVIPNIDFSKVPKYWENIKKLNDDKKNTKLRDTLIHSMSKSLSDLSKINNDELQLIAKKTDQFLKKLIPKLNSFFPKLNETTLDIKITPTCYGTRVSFFKPLFLDNHFKINIILRKDVDIEYLLEGIVSAIVYISRYIPRGAIGNWQDEWEINESIVDFLLIHTHLYELFPFYEPTIQHEKKTECSYANLIADSKRLYSQLGFPLYKALTIQDGDIYINEKKPKAIFSPTEEKVLKHLITRKNDIVSNEDIETVIWGENSDKYSLWAVSKLIQRIREKLKKNGITTDILQTLRGQGYLLYD